MIKVLELFGGIGACTTALKRLNIPYEVVDYVEIDKYAVASYNAINGTNFEPQDIMAWNKNIDVDLIMHGSPCQDFSLAGKQAGGDKDSGTRSSLMYETIRIVKKLKPKYVIWENVKNLLSKKHRHNFDNYLKTLEELGYTNYYQILNAKDYEIPQHRERVFTISIHHKCDEIFTFPINQTLNSKLKDFLDSDVDEKYYLTVEQIERISHWKSYQKPFTHVHGRNSISPTLTVRGAGEEHSGMILYSEELEDTTNLQNECLYIKNFTKQGYLEAHEGDGVYITNIDKKRGTVQKDMIPTLKTSPDIGVVVEDLRIRKLTPKECWRLMGFNDYEFGKAEKVNSNSQLYKQAGNSIVVNVLESVLKNLIKRG